MKVVDVGRMQQNTGMFRMKILSKVEPVTVASSSAMAILVIMPH